ncbi:ABC transporter permease [Vagococcus sp. BWB3-3]|uniref:ABC transporter permease n=1 Tax=Vagococcus allomyrinae TaxID=2794353 RepID=A0A940P8Z4_9ENTE|nr:ABC transporter permease [Vagococcus allomyrinae]MBP1040142.1 ABC transporter permease [Vagococcus allomyrinae]
MIRLMKADFYRVWHTKGFLATIGLVIAFAVMIVATESSGGIGVDTALPNLQGGSLKNSIFLAVFSSSMLLYLLIGVFVIIIGYEFSQKNYKNSLTAGVSRFQFILSKYLSEVIYLSTFVLLYFTAAMVTGIVKFGGTQNNLASFLLETLLLAVAIGLIISVIFCMATVLLVATGSTIIPTVFIVIYPILLQIIAVLTKWNFLKYFDFLNFVQLLGRQELSGEQLIPYVVTGVSVTIVSLIASTLIIRNKEL